MSLEPLIFLDKDGTVIEDLPYNVDPLLVRFMPGSREGLRLLGTNGWRVVIATNQSGVARGYHGLSAVHEVGEFLVAEFAKEGVDLAGFYVCPHLPEGITTDGVACSCRKPAPGLLLQAAADLRADLGRSWFIGDTWKDAAAGRAAGCRTILIGRDWRDAQSLSPALGPDIALPDLLAAARHIGPRPAHQVPFPETADPTS